jgi:UDP-2,3-diacylglucosamine pyrophosphatase LpxH
VKLVIYNDLHIGGPKEVMSLTQFRESLRKDENEDVWLLGDIIEMKNCKKSEVGNLGWELTDLYRRYGKQYIFGNHEGMKDIGLRFVKYHPTQAYPNCPAIILSHGDFEAWGEERALKFRHSPHGAGTLKRTLVAAIDEARLFVEAKLSQAHIDRACTLMRDNKCSVYICGHKHPKKMIVHETNGMKIIVLPKGRNALEVVV